MSPFSVQRSDAHDNNACSADTCYTHGAVDQTFGWNPSMDDIMLRALAHQSQLHLTVDIRI